MRIYLNKDTHTYIKGTEEYTSVSALTSLYKQPFNQEYWSWRKAYERYMEEEIIASRTKEGAKSIADSSITKLAKAAIKDNISRFLISKESDISLDIDERENLDLLVGAINYAKPDIDKIVECRKEILDIWKGKKDSASLKGNSYHRGREIGAIKRGFEVNAFDNKEYELNYEWVLQSYPEFNDPTMGPMEALIWNLDNAEIKWSLTEDYEDLPDGFYPELLIWNDNNKIAGMSDRIFIDTLNIGRVVDVDDYKTNAVIDKKSFFERGKGYRMMQYPLDHLMDCKHTHYHLQVSVYAYMLEQMGFLVREVGYHHLNFLNRLDYLREEVAVMLAHFRNGKLNESI